MELQVSISSISACSFSALQSTAPLSVKNNLVAPETSVVNSAPEDSLSLTTSKEMTDSQPALKGAAAKPKLSDAQIEANLKAVFAQAPSEDTRVPASFGADDFMLAACSLDTEGPVPTRADTVGYEFLSPGETAAAYEADVKPNLKFAERGCIKAYCTYAYKSMNQYLTGAKGSPTGVLRKAVNCMSGALNRFEVPQGSILYRTANINELHNYVPNDDFEKYAKYDEQGKTRELAEILDCRLQGKEMVRRTFLSTTIDHKFDFEDRPKVATKFYVGDNVHGIYVAADPKLTRFPNEKEYLLAPDTKVTVLGCDYNEKNKGMVLHVFLGDLPENQEAARG